MISHESCLSDADIVSSMVAWFGRHFVAPTNAIPSYGRNSPFAWGGPYRADQVLFERFSNSEKRLIDQAVQQIEQYGPVAWAPSRFHIQEKFLWDEKSGQGERAHQNAHALLKDQHLRPANAKPAVMAKSQRLTDRMLAWARKESLNFVRQFKKELIGKLAKAVAAIIMLTLMEHLFGMSDRALEWLKLSG